MKSIAQQREMRARLAGGLGRMAASLAAASLVALSPAAVAAAAGAAKITKVVDSFDAVPDRAGAAFVFPGGTAGRPTVADGRAIFLAYDGSQWALWSVPLAGGTALRLVDTATAIPGGGGALFANLNWYRAAGKKLSFYGTDYAGHNGFYVVSPKGGKLHTLVDQDTPVPGGSGSFGAGLAGGGGSTTENFDFDGRTLVFNDQHGSYAVDAGSTAISVLGDARYWICLTGYGFGGVGSAGIPAVSGSVSVSGNYNVFGHTALIDTPISGVSGVADACANPLLKADNVAPVATATMAAPGDPLGRNFDIWGFGRPVIGGNDRVWSSGLWNPDKNAYDPGLYSSAGGGTQPRLVASNTTTPPHEKGPLQSFLSDYAVAGGHVAFSATGASGLQAVYTATVNGTKLRRLVRVGDTLPDGRIVYGINGAFQQPPMQNRSFVGSDLVLRLEFTDPVLGFGTGLYRLHLKP